MWMLILVFSGQLEFAYFVGQDVTPVIYTLSNSQGDCERIRKEVLQNIDKGIEGHPLIATQCVPLPGGLNDR
jgi:hypothetical protein